MASSTAVAGPAGERDLALLGLTGALLSAVGDVLILGRSCSGREFDRATGMVPPHVDADDRWRSLWNGAQLPVRRLHAGALVGDVGIGLLQGLALRGLSRTLPAGPERRVAAAAASTFAVSGVLTHQCCAGVVLAHRRTRHEAPGSRAGSGRAPRGGTRLLAVSTAASLGSLAAFSASLTVSALRRRQPGPAWRSAVTPFPPVLAALLTFGALPAPVGGYARPASISIGLIAFFAVAAMSGESRRPGAGIPVLRAAPVRPTAGPGGRAGGPPTSGPGRPSPRPGWSR